MTKWVCKCNRFLLFMFYTIECESSFCTWEQECRASERNHITMFGPNICCGKCLYTPKHLIPVACYYHIFYVLNNFNSLLFTGGYWLLTKCIVLNNEI